MRVTASKNPRPEPTLAVGSAAAWRTWLASHHARSTGVLLRITKTGAGARKALTYAEALDQTAKKSATRTDRIARFVAMCARGETVHPIRPEK